MLVEAGEKDSLTIFIIKIAHLREELWIKVFVLVLEHQNKLK